MKEYLSRSELTQVDRVATRLSLAVPAVQPISAYNGPAPNESRASNGEAASLLSEDDLASAAEYAKVHARVADILAELRSAASALSVDAAEVEIQSMVPTPMILVPLPPASKEAVESAVKLGKRIAEQANYAHAAQAHLRRGAVDQILSIAV